MTKTETRGVQGGVSMAMLQTRVIAIFAHNEAKNVASCLKSVKLAMRDGDVAYVLNNGSTDDTGAIVDRFAERNSFCRLLNIETGDKANAWNVFCHEICASADLYIFLDGDCTVAPHSFDELESHMRGNPHLNAVSGAPDASSSSKYRKAVLQAGGVVGNLYALQSGFMDRIRSQNVRLPCGFIGEDSLVGALARWDLDPRANWDRKRTMVCGNATFAYRRLSYLSMSDIRLYWRRKVRYSMRGYQLNLIRPRMKSHGLAGIPRDVSEMYDKSAPELKLMWNGLDTWFDYLALRRIRSGTPAHTRARLRKRLE